MYALSMALLLVVPLSAQPVKKVQIIEEMEVPVVVRRSLIENFGQLGEGTWSVAFHVLSNGSRTTAQPLHYTFKKKNGADRVEVKFTPEGKIESSRGVERLSPATP